MFVGLSILNASAGQKICVWSDVINRKGENNEKSWKNYKVYTHNEKLLLESGWILRMSFKKNISNIAEVWILNFFQTKVWLHGFRSGVNGDDLIYI